LLLLSVSVLYIMKVNIHGQARPMAWHGRPR